ncbi:Ran-specific GTPase-activating protein 30 [Friedmanniomyces endolithicus]|nr:Ran-specific GTPase-activating protein 30 [Friedmanniomyces endolithicus]KAK0805173.1 Ran-specific GTPase-activating protein 30 [Friedmanniomyces endolithicus]KAK0814448.1 Ran-specific GTPase-activating protein 30 [Friedmanniomyces endolithicus]KAK0818402.1 Ran-specific GTPase-activating protein 30 [Friedmanniomyces endolithicus]KAK0856078.1 Ran-specific GTPase-activating protein 30 [Friedmanniomyces endolithicus]
MDILLGRVTQQAMNYAIRSGVTITATYAFKQCGRLLKEAPRSKDREELMQLQLRLESKIRVISPAIDMIELISARGNTSLEPAVGLTKDLRYEIQRLGTRLSDAANDEELLRRKSGPAKSREATEREMKSIISSIKSLLVRIEDAVPLISLAITTSGVNLSTNLSGTISPSRLLQASTFLTAADSKYTAEPGARQQVGPTYTLSMYMLFAGHIRPTDDKGIRETTWKEVIHKARVKLFRVALDQLYSLPGEQIPSKGYEAGMLPGFDTATEFEYQLVIVEDLDDGRVHTFEENDPQPGSFDDTTNAGIRDAVPIHEVSKIFYADTGKILGIGGDGDAQNPVLLIKRDVHAAPPRSMLHRSQMERSYFESPSVGGAHHTDDSRSEIDAQFERESASGTPSKGMQPEPATASTAWRLPADLDPEWIAFEVYAEEPESDTEEDESSLAERTSSARQSSLDPELTGALAKLQLRSSTSTPPMANGQLVHSQRAKLQASQKPAWPPIKTSLSLLEMLIKLTALQQFKQESHLVIGDEMLNFFLEDTATAGAGPDKDRRQRIRHDALRRVGFDPYDESPIKRRGEEHIRGANARGTASPRHDFNPDAFTPASFPYDDSYGYDSDQQSPYPPREYDEQAPPDYPQYSRDPTPSSPSSRPLLLHQTPSRNSRPGSAATSERHRSAVQAKYAGSPRSSPSPSPQAPVSAIQTPPSTARSRQTLLRAQTEPKAGSPLVREYLAKGNDSGFGSGGPSDGETG